MWFEIYGITVLLTWIIIILASKQEPKLQEIRAWVKVVICLLGPIALPFFIYSFLAGVVSGIIAIIKNR